MKQSSNAIQVLTLMTLVIVLSPCIAAADGGIIRLREAQGPFLVTLFLSSEMARDEPTDVSLLIQQRTNGAAILDADVGLTFVPPTGSAHSADPLCGMLTTGVPKVSDASGQTLNIQATRRQAANKLLYAALLKLNATGNWQLQINVTRGGDRALFESVIPVSTASTSLHGLWPYLLLPPLIVTLFTMNQWLRNGGKARA